MGKRTKSNIIPQLHDLGKDLRLLKHLFESYKALIQTILAPPDTDVSERVQLEQQSRDRFRRLGDRLQLLMLNTIGEYLDEKSELSSTVSPHCCGRERWANLTIIDSISISRRRRTRRRLPA